MAAFLRTRYLWCLLCTCQVLCLSPARAQTAPATPSVSGIPLTGKVTTTTGEALPGVTILQKGTQRGATTDADGNFTFSVPDPTRGDGPATLTVSFVGFVTQEIPVGSQTSFTIQLKEDAQALSEVVVVGYGT